MIDTPIFVVYCERIRKRSAYYLKFPYNEQLVAKIKELPHETRKWSALTLAWEVSTQSLFLLIKKFKGSNKIHFDFGNEDSRKIFIDQIKKIELEEEEKRKFIADLNIKKEHWVKYKQELEETYVEYSDKMHTFLNEGIKLYPHQIVSVMYLTAVRNALLALDMGTGKSIISIAYAEMNGFKKVFVITPNSLKFNYYNEVKKFTKSNAYIIGKKNDCSIEDAKYIIVNYEYFNSGEFKKIKSKLDNLNIGKIDCLIADECFPYETKVLTTIGEIEIGKIVENKLDVEVLSYNHKLNNIESKPIVKYLYNGEKKTIKVKLSNGSVIETTENHKFYSVDDCTYKPIALFKIGEKLYEYKKEKNINDNNGMYTLQTTFQTKKKFTKILFEKLFRESHFRGKCEKIVNHEIEKWKSFTNNKYNLFYLSNNFSNKRTSWSKILFEKLFSKMENGTSGNKRKSIYERNCTKNIRKNKKNIFGKFNIWRKSFKKNETRQSNVLSEKCGKNEIKINWENVFIKRWKWSINETTIKTFFCNIWNNIYGNGICYTSNIGIEEACWNRNNISTNTLQNRHWYTEYKISNRNRWKFPQNKKMEIFGQKKNGNISIVWVEDITVLELGGGQRVGECCSGNKKVYNLEILDNHNYFANNILVSNCHRLKSTKSNTYINFKKIFNDDFFNNKISKIFMSGTPAPSKALELYSVLNQISPIDFSSKTYFMEYYCGMKYNIDGWGYETNSMLTKFDELFNKISPYVYRKKKSEVLKDLPEKMYQKIILEMTPKEYEIYYDLEEGVANEFVNKTLNNPLTIMGKLREYTSHLKVNNTIELIDLILESDEKFVAIDFFKSSLYKLHEHYPDLSALHTGDQKDFEKNEVVKDFQNPNGKIKIFLGSQETTKEGLTLTEASKVGILSIPWTPGTLDQCTDRLCRIGQKNAVNAYLFIYKDTIDEYIFNLIESKRNEISQVIDGVKYESDINQSIINDLINIIKEKHKK